MVKKNFKKRKSTNFEIEILFSKFFVNQESLEKISEYLESFLKVLEISDNKILSRFEIVNLDKYINTLNIQQRAKILGFYSTKLRIVCFVVYQILHVLNLPIVKIEIDKNECSIKTIYFKVKKSRRRC